MKKATREDFDNLRKKAIEIYKKNSAQYHPDSMFWRMSGGDVGEGYLIKELMDTLTWEEYWEMFKDG